jgi:hypothetical protein
MLLMPSGASAHFVWAETDPAAKDAARVCFGEYPSLREGAPLLDRVARTRVFALDAKGRRELKTERGDKYFRAAGVNGAPVVLARLDYGVLERPNTPPYVLRYQAQLLLGDGKPLSVEKLAALSALKSEFPVTVGLKAAGGDAVELTAHLEGKPVAAEVWSLNPKQAEALKAKGEMEGDEGASSTTEKTSADGKLRLSLKDAGWYYLRVKVDDPRPSSLETPEGKKSAPSARTYLSLLFHSAGSGESSAASKAGAARLVNAAQEGGEKKKFDEEVVKLLQDAHTARAAWDTKFPGFTADATYEYGGKVAKGTITVDKEFKITYALGDPEAEKLLQPGFGSLIMHRRGGNPTYFANWKDNLPNPLGRAISLNDEAESVYRIKDRQIMEVNRKMGTGRFTNVVLANEATPYHTFLPRAWTITYFDAAGVMTRSATTQVTWGWIGEVFIPSTYQVVTATPGGVQVAHLRLTNQRLLK